MNWWKSVIKASLIFILIGSGPETLGQYWTELQQKFPGYQEYIIQQSQAYNISVEKNGLSVTQDNYYESIILSDTGIHNNQESFTYSSLVPVKSFDAYTVIDNRGKERKIPVSKAVDVAADQQNIFHSDVKEKKLTFSNLQVGAKKVYRYETEFKDPFLLHKFIFDNYYPAEKYRLEITTGKDVEIGYKIFNDPENRINFNKIERRGKWVYSWELDESLPVQYEPDNPGYLHIVPHIVFYVKNYSKNNETVPVLGSVDLLYEYYKKFTSELNLTEDENLKNTTLRITENLSNNEEKIKAIFYWVKENIKYVAFEEAYEGFIPREAKLVYERKFGDCKDMSSIITEMAKYAGVPGVNLSWIGTRRIPYSYHEVPTPAVDDHMIATYETENGEIIFLDGTDSYTAFGLPSSFIQGKEAMIQNGDTYKIVPVPVVSAEANKVREIIDVEIKNSLLKGTGKVTMEGLARSSFQNMLGDSREKTRFDLIKAQLELGNNKFILNNFDEANLADKDAPYAVDFEFELDNYLINAGNETYVNLFLKKPFEKIHIGQDRRAQLEFAHLVKEIYQFTIKIPEGYTLKYLPKNFGQDNELMKYHIEYVVLDNKVQLNFVIETKKLLLSPSDFQIWNQSLKELKSHYNENLIFTTK